MTSSAFGLGLGWGTFGKACLAVKIMNLADFAGWKQVLKTPHYIMTYYSFPRTSSNAIETKLTMRIDFIYSIFETVYSLHHFYCTVLVGFDN